MKGADLTPPQSPHSTKSSRLGDHVQNYTTMSGRGQSWSNHSVSNKSTESSTLNSDPDVFDNRSGVGVGFTFDAFGLDASQINAQVNEAMQDIAGSHPDLSFFRQEADDDFANGRWNLQASPAPSRASTPPISEDGDDFVDGFRVTKQASLPVQVRQQHSPSPSERSSLTSESNQDDGRVNLFKEREAFASSKPRMLIRPGGPDRGLDRNLDGDDESVDRRGRVPSLPELQMEQVEFVGEDSETSDPPAIPRRAQAVSDTGVSSEVGFQSGADSDVAVESDYGRPTHRPGLPELPLEVSAKDKNKKSSTDTETTTESSSTYQLTSEEKKEEDRQDRKSTSPAKNVMPQWQQRDKSVERSGAMNRYSPTKTRQSEAESAALTRQSLDKYQSGLELQPQSQWMGSNSPRKSPYNQDQRKPSNQFESARSEGGAGLVSSHVHSVMERIQTSQGIDVESKSDAGISPTSPYNVNLRKTGRLNTSRSTLMSRPSEDDAERPVTPLAKKRSPEPFPSSGQPLESRPYERDQQPFPAPVQEPKKLTYRERRELELQQQREEDSRKQLNDARQSPEKHVAALVRKRIAANKDATPPPSDEARDRLNSLRPTVSPTRHGENYRQPSQESSRTYERQQFQSRDVDVSRDLSIESAGNMPAPQNSHAPPSSAVSHLRMLQQLQSKSEPQSVGALLISVGSMDDDSPSKKSTTPKATRMMLNAFLNGRSSIGDGEDASAVESRDMAPSAAHGLPALKDDPKYTKYFKMLKLGMPLEVVQHAMIRDGEDPSVMDQDHNKPSGIPLKDDPTYQKYFKMLKIGMQLEAVKHAMLRDGLDCSVMDQDHNLPAKKQSQQEDDEPKERDSRRRARLHWKTLRKVTSNSLWAKLDQETDMSQIEIDEDEFQELFQAEHDEVKPATAASAAPARKGANVRVIDPKRANNGGIILARLKMSHDDMADAVDRINEQALSAEQIENIVEYLPSLEERKALEAYMLEGGQDAAEKFDGLCECEKFMVSMMTVKHAKRKVRALLFKLQFEKCLDDILKDTLAIEAACDNLTHSVRLRTLFGIILNFGNRLNTAGNKRRKAGAFTLDSLLKLQQAKAFDRKTTFLHYIILIVQRNNELLLNFKDDLPAVFKSDKVFWDQCLSDLEEVESQLENVRKIALYQARQSHYRFRRKKRQEDGGNESLSDGDTSLSLEEEVEALRSTPIGMFTLSAIKYVSSLRDKVEDTKSKFAHLLEYLGEEDKKRAPHELFSTIVTFCRDFDKAKEEVFAHEKKKQREERKRQAGRPPTHSHANSPVPTEKQRQGMLKASNHQPTISGAIRGGDGPGPRPRARNGYDQPVQSHQVYQSRPKAYEQPSARVPSNPGAPTTYEGQQPPRQPGHDARAYSYDRSPPKQQASRSDIGDQRYRTPPSAPHASPPPPTNAQSTSPSGPATAAVRLKAKARIQQQQRRASPPPPDNQDAYYEDPRSRAANAQAAARDFGRPSHDYAAAPPPPIGRSPEPQPAVSTTGVSPRASFRHKRRMEVRARIRQEASRDY
jgi:hypothetical protein